MEFMEAVKTVFLKKYATFSGRASRSEFWWFMLFIYLMLLVLISVFVTIGITLALATNYDEKTAALMIVGIGFLPPMACLFVFFIPMIAVAVRRLHDRNMSGWWYLLFMALSIIPLIGYISGIIAIIIFAQKGTDGQNRFGPDPLASQSAVTA